MLSRPDDPGARLSPEAAVEFRRTLGVFPTGVAVVTAVTPSGVPVGMTVNSFSSVSLDPPLVLWNIRVASGLHPIFAEAPGYAINLLSEDQAGIGRLFAGRSEDRFGQVTMTAGLHGAPLIEGCAASFECEPYQRHRAGDHDIMVGLVRRFASAPAREAALFYKGAFGQMDGRPALAADKGG